jgi:hypothetical protein
MRPRAIALFVGCCLGCGSAQRSPAVGPGATVNYAVIDQAEERICQSPVTPQATCTVTLTAHVALGELEGREWQLVSIQGVVRDARSGQDLHAVPGALTSADIRLITGTSVLPAFGRLTIPLQLQFRVGQAPFYVDGPHDLHVTVLATVSGASTQVS